MVPPARISAAKLLSPQDVQVDLTDIVSRLR